MNKQIALNAMMFFNIDGDTWPGNFNVIKYSNRINMHIIMFVLCLNLTFKQIQLLCELNIDISVQYLSTMIRKHINCSNGQRFTVLPWCLRLSNW